MNKIVLSGKAASGKDYMRKLLESRGFTFGVSYTSRPPRPGEIEGKDYYFLSKEKFMEMIENKEFYEWVEFNNWYYGTTKKQWYNDCNLFIMTPAGISHIKKEDRKEATIFYIDIPIEIRRERLKNRNDSNDSNERRIEADERDFREFKDYDIRITNPNF